MVRAGTPPFTIATDHFAYWIHQNPSFDWHTVTETSFVTDFFNSEAKFEDVIGTDSTDLEGFIDRKAKDSLNVISPCQPDDGRDHRL